MSGVIQELINDYPCLARRYKRNSYDNHISEMYLSGALTYFFGGRLARDLGIALFVPAAYAVIWPLFEERSLIRIHFLDPYNVATEV